MLALSCAALAGWVGMAGGWLWTDYEYANVPGFDAMLRGDWGVFLQSAPIEGPSLLMRSPFVFLPSLWGGDHDSIFRTVAIPGLAAGAVLATVLWKLRRHRFGGSRFDLLVVVLAAANPITLSAVETGHPEELFGAALCVGAVIAALHDRRALAALLLGLALANKAWAVLAIGPVLLALDGGRWRTLVGSGAVALVFVAPFLLNDAARAAVVSAGDTDHVFQPWQIWWPLGEAGHEIRGFGGILKEDYRAAPGWISLITHPLIALLVIPASVMWARRRRVRSVDLLLLLAVLLLARCVLDVANNAYYHLPFVLALLAWETLRSTQPPVLTLTASSLVWLTCERLPELVSPDLQWFFYVAWAVPVLLALTALVFEVPMRWGRQVAVAPAR